MNLHRESLLTLIIPYINGFCSILKQIYFLFSEYHHCAVGCAFSDIGYHINFQTSNRAIALLGKTWGYTSKVVPTFIFQLFGIIQKTQRGQFCSRVI